MAEKQDAPSLGGFLEISNALMNPGGRTTLGGGTADLSSDAAYSRSDDDDNSGVANFDDKDSIDTDVISGTEDPILTPDEIAAKEAQMNEGIDDDLDDTDDTDDDLEVDQSKSKEDDEKTDDADEDLDLSEYEEDITNVLREKLEASLGWEIPEDYEIKTIEDVVSFMKDLTTEASQPKYASDDIKKLDDFVKDGGDLKHYYDTIVAGKLELESINLENESDQKKVISEQLKRQGYTQDQINKRVTRYEEAGVLDDEAADSYEMLKEYNALDEQRLLETTQKQAKAAKEEQQKFITTVQESVKNLKSIRGITLSAKDTADLSDYILKLDNTGMSQYQKDYMSNISNLVESAYFTKNGQALVDKSKQKGKTDAYKTLQQKLKMNKGNKGKNTQGQDFSNNSSSSLSLIGASLLGNS